MMAHNNLIESNNTSFLLCGFFLGYFSFLGGFSFLWSSFFGSFGLLLFDGCLLLFDGFLLFDRDNLLLFLLLGGSFSFFGLVEDVGETTFSAVLAIKMARHEGSSTTRLIGAFSSQTSDLAILINLVVLEDGQFDFFSLVSEFLGLGVGFFFLFLPPPRSLSTRWRVDSFWML